VAVLEKYDGLSRKKISPVKLM